MRIPVGLAAGVELAPELEDEMVEVVLGSSADVEVEDTGVETASVTGSELAIHVDEGSGRKVSPSGAEVEVGEAEALMARAFFSAAFVTTGRGLAAAFASRSLRQSMLVKHLFWGRESPCTVVASKTKRIVQRIMVMRRASQIRGRL